MRRKFFTDLPVRRNVDAVFVASFAIDEKEVEQLKRIRVPIIGINTPSIDGFDASISIDDENGMYTATQHLLNLGHKHIVYACSAASESMDSSIDARGRGFIRACENVEKRRETQLAGGHRAARTRVRRFGAVGAARAGPSSPTHLLPDRHDGDSADAQARTLRTPHATRLLDHRLRRQPYADTVNLTTMKQDPFKMGRSAAQKAIKLINGEEPEKPHEIVQPTLMLRESDALYTD